MKLGFIAAVSSDEKLPLLRMVMVTETTLTYKRANTPGFVGVAVMVMSFAVPLTVLPFTATLVDWVSVIVVLPLLKVATPEPVSPIVSVMEPGDASVTL